MSMSIMQTNNLGGATWWLAIKSQKRAIPLHFPAKTPLIVIHSLI